MTKKSYLIIFGSILFVVILVLVLYFVLSKKVVNQESQPAQPTTTQNAATFPGGTKSPDSQSGQNAATPSLEVPANPQNIQIVQKNIENTAQEPISSQTSQKGSKTVKFNDQNNDPIPLSDFEKSTGITINQQLQSYLDNKDYNIFYCPGANKEKDFGAYFGYNVQKAYDNLYPDTITWMKGWEKTMLRDLHTVLFPDMNFSDSDLDQNLQFKDGKYRYAEIHLPNGKVGSINYHVSDNGVLISAAPSCLDKLVQVYEPVQP